jgi:hypothetical protein
MERSQAAGLERSLRCLPTYYPGGSRPRGHRRRRFSLIAAGGLVAVFATLAYRGSVPAVESAPAMLLIWVVLPRRVQAVEVSLVLSQSLRDNA